VPEYSVPEPSESGPERRPLVGGEDYKVRLLSLEVKLKASAFDPVAKNWWVLKMAAISFADGAPLEDIDGNPVTDERWLWCDVEPTRLGFQQNGTASKTRQFLLAANGISDMAATLPGGNTDDLINREFVVTVAVTPKQKNKVTAFKSLSRRRGQAQVATDTPSGNDEYTARVARLMNGEADEADKKSVEDFLNGDA